MDREKKQGIQIFSLTLWSFLFVLPLIVGKGPNIVIRTFMEGGQRFWSGISPYGAPGPGADIFHYSPFFAMFFGVFNSLPPILAMALWTLFNGYVFWSGLSRWFSFGRQTSLWLWGALILCSMELDISLRYQQSNALLTGLVLHGLAFYRDKRFSYAGLALALAVNLKVVPLAFAGALLLRPRAKYIAAFSLGSFCLFLLPALVTGMSTNLAFHYDQWHAILTDLPGRQLSDIRSAMARLSLPQIGEALRYFVAFSSLLGLVGLRLMRPDVNMPWGTWFSLGMAGALLLIPRVESPTFVWVAPSYLFLMEISAPRFRPFVFAAGIPLTVMYTSLWPKAFKGSLHVMFTSKALGTLGLWFIALCLVLRLVRSHMVKLQPE